MNNETLCERFGVPVVVMLGSHYINFLDNGTLCGLSQVHIMVKSGSHG